MTTAPVPTQAEVVDALTAGGHPVWLGARRSLLPGAHGAVLAPSDGADLVGVCLRLSGFETRDTVVLAREALLDTLFLVRAPLAERTVASNVLCHGAGAVNIDACRVSGRWPAHLLLDDGAAAILDSQSGVRASGAPGVMRKKRNDGAAFGAESRAPGTRMTGYGDSGGASRFFSRVNSAEDLLAWLRRLIVPDGGAVLDPFGNPGG